MEAGEDNGIEGRARRDVMRKLKMHALTSVITIAVGVAFMMYMILVEDEPGAVPLLLIVLGIGWLVVTRARMRSHPG